MQAAVPGLIPKKTLQWRTSIMKNLGRNWSVAITLVLTANNGWGTQHANHTSPINWVDLSPLSAYKGKWGQQSDLNGIWTQEIMIIYIIYRIQLITPISSNIISSSLVLHNLLTLNTRQEKQVIRLCEIKLGIIYELRFFILYCASKYVWN